MAYFPMYMQLENKNCLLIGSNAAIWRKIKAVQDFGAHVKVIAPQIPDKIRQADNVLWEERNFTEEDLEGADLVIVSTDDAEVNHQVSLLCRARKIPVNVVDQMEDCTFIFPSYIKRGEVIASFSSGGTSPVITQYLKAAAEPLVTEHLGEMAACLGTLRKTVRECVAAESERKAVYEEILRLGLESKEIPSSVEIYRIIEHYSRKG